MPHTITFEREKLNQAMYQKLKKFIMGKRKREAEERAQADYYKRLKKEREERRRQIKFSTESLENTRCEIYEAKKRIAALKNDRDALFTKFKQITQEYKYREAEIRARSQQAQMEKAGLYADQFQSRAPQEALLLLSKAPHKGFNSSNSLDVINQANALRKQVGQLYCPTQFPPSTTTHTGHESSSSASVSHSLNSGVFSSLDKRQMAMYGSMIPQQQQMNPKSMTEATVGNVFGNRELSQLELQTISKYLAEYGAAGGKVQSAELLNAINAGPLSAFLSNPKFAAILAASSLGSNTRSPSVSSTSSSGQQQSSLGTGVSSGGTFLPPAPTGYRGSITTGQSAQQIQLAQQLAAQQQVAALYGVGRASSQSQQSSQQQ
ncbi:unnamed protein product [Hymenolepis diminuta]|nr:unnamed protein product [Hymenolepis diminuta]